MTFWEQRERARQILDKEIGYTRKPHGDRLRVALAFPNTYWVGMSNLGFQTIYRLLNAEDDIVCERFFLPPKQELAALIDKGLVRLSLSRKLDATAAGLKFWTDHKPLKNTGHQ